MLKYGSCEPYNATDKICISLLSALRLYNFFWVQLYHSRNSSAKDNSNCVRKIRRNYNVPYNGIRSNNVPDPYI